MKSRISDQAEKLRQLAAHETGAQVVLEKPEKPLEDGSISSAPPLSSTNEDLHSQNKEKETGKDKNHKSDLPPQSESKRENTPADLKKSSRTTNDPKTDGAADQPKPLTAKSSEAASPVSPPALPEEEKGGENLKQAAKEAAGKKPLSKIKKSESPPSEKEKTSAVSSVAASTRFPMQKTTQVIAVTGGKGGVGKSNIACNLAIAMAQMNKHVMVLDADLSLANVDVLLGLTPRYNLSHLIRGVKTMKEIMIEGPAGVRIIPGGSGVEELTQLNSTEMARLFSAFDGIQPAPDIFLIDTAAGIHPNVMQFLTAADQVIVVTTPEPTAYTDAYALIKTLLKHQNGQEIGLLVNMAQNAREAAEVLRLMLQMCRQFLNLSFNNIGFVPRDPDVLKAVRYQKPFLLRSPNSPASKTIRNIAATILQIEFKNNQSKGLRRFFQRFFKTDPVRETVP
ncbi:MAG: P-loop NTPase [Candidatus Hinthialibacter sp.]